MNDELKSGVRAVREHLAALGYPLDDLTDEEVVEGVDRLGRAVASTGVSAQEAAESLNRVMKAIA